MLNESLKIVNTLLKNWNGLFRRDVDYILCLLNRGYSFLGDFSLDIRVASREEIREWVKTVLNYCWEFRGVVLYVSLDSVEFSNDVGR